MTVSLFADIKCQLYSSQNIKCEWVNVWEVSASASLENRLDESLKPFISQFYFCTNSLLSLNIISVSLLTAKNIFFTWTSFLKTLFFAALKRVGVITGLKHLFSFLSLLSILFYGNCTPLLSTAVWGWFLRILVTGIFSAESIWYSNFHVCPTSTH